MIPSIYLSREWNGIWPPKEIVDNYNIKCYPPIEDPYINFWERVYLETNFKNVLEIGFNAGHTSHHLISKYNCLVTSVDNCWSRYTPLCMHLLKKLYPHNFQFIQKSSENLTEFDFNNKFDLIFIDGNHSYSGIRNDLELAYKLKIKYVVFDDLDMKTTNDVILHLSDKFDMKSIFTSTYIGCGTMIIGLYSMNLNLNKSII